MKFNRLFESDDNLKKIANGLDLYGDKLQLDNSSILNTYNKKGILYDQAVMYTGYTPSKSDERKLEKTILFCVNDHKEGSYIKYSKGKKIYIHNFKGNWKKWGNFIKKYFNLNDILDMRFKRNEV